jgi:hypothetical protein
VKLFFQVVAFAAVIVALVWAKKQFLDAPKQEQEAFVPAAAPKAKPLTFGNDGNVVAQPQPQSAVQTPSEPQPTGKVEDNAIAKLLNRFTGGEGKPEDRARIRMKAFMQAWKQGGTSGSDAEQAASCLYSRGKLFIPNADEIRDAYNGFVAFRKEKNLYTEINDYSIADTISRGNDQAHGDYTEFDVTINGFPYAMGVPDKPNPIFWIR